MNPVTVKVTREHIEKGNRHNCHSCPIALAIEEAMHADQVSWFFSTGKVGDYYVEARNPDYLFLQKWVDAFDNGQEVEPFTLRLVVMGSES